MCGFAGIVTWDDRYHVRRQTLDAMSARLAHRGPDGEGIWLNHNQTTSLDRPQAGLVHRRLAILDPDPRANQPFTDGAGRWIVFNGEIYNFRRLRAELSNLRPDYAWRTQCDTEVLLLAGDVWGEECVDHLEGMFAFAMWDEPRRKLFLARDRMGQKPLYYTETGERVIVFASELPALLCVDWVSRDIRPDGVYEYLRRGCQGFGNTLYEGIQQLQPGWKLSIGDRGIEHVAPYFDANETDPAQPRAADASPREASTTTRCLVLNAVRDQLVSDVPLGVFLSGGVDSSVIAAAASAALRSSGAMLETFSIGFEDPQYDETPFAQKVAAHLNTRHHSFTVRPDAANDLPKLAAAFGEPFADSSALPTHYLARETRQHVKVALSGDGGDELFGGYDRYRAMPLGELLRRAAPSSLLQVAAGSLTTGRHPKSLASRASRFLRTLSLDAADRYTAYGEIFSAAQAAELHSTPISAWPPDHHAEAYHRLRDGRDVVQAALALDRVSYLPDDLLTKVDRCSMLHALEVRSPFMDHHLVRFAAGLTTPQLLGGGKKRMLREAFRHDLPRWVFERRKMGFAVPIGQWFRTSLRGMLRDSLFARGSFSSAHFNRAVVERFVDQHESNAVDHSQRLYALLMLELWWKSTR